MKEVVFGLIIKDIVNDWAFEKSDTEMENFESKEQ